MDDGIENLAFRKDISTKSSAHKKLSASSPDYLSLFFIGAIERVVCEIDNHFLTTSKGLYRIPYSIILSLNLFLFQKVEEKE